MRKGISEQDVDRRTEKARHREIENTGARGTYIWIHDQFNERNDDSLYRLGAGQVHHRNDESCAQCIPIWIPQDGPGMGVV